MKKIITLFTSIVLTCLACTAWAQTTKTVTFTVDDFSNFPQRQQLSKTTTLTKDGVTFTTNNCGFYGDIRLYKNSRSSLSVANGNIIKITFNIPEKKNFGFSKNISIEKGNYNNSVDLKGVWTGQEQKVDISVKQKMKFESIEVTYELTPQSYTATLHSLNNEYWGTLYLPYGVSLPEGTVAYWGEVMGDHLQLHQLTQIPAQTAVVIKGNAAEITFTEDNSLTAMPALENNALVGVDTDTPSQPENFYLGHIDQVLGLYHWTGTLAAHHAYLPGSKVSEGTTIKGLPFMFDETTAVQQASLAPKTTAIFDLQGRKVKTPQKGQLYIINGKKIIY